MNSASLRYRRRWRATAILALACLSGILAVISETSRAHVFVAKTLRVGAYPPYDGGGWFVRAFLDVPNLDLAHHASLHKCMDGPGQAYTNDCARADLDRDGDVDLRDMAKLQRDFHRANLVQVERYVEGQVADFTFRTEWIDFPAGEVDSDLDANFDTVGDFLNDYIFDVSDPSKLDEPFGSLLLRFSGFIKVTLEDEVRVRDYYGLPIWIDTGSMGYDGYRTSVGLTVYRVTNVNWVRQPFYNFGPSIEVQGLYPIEITYFNSYDPDAAMGNERAGIEVYSWHGGGLPWPAGLQMVHDVFGPATLLPPRVIYQWQDIRPLVSGDFDADTDVDFRDFQWFQNCFDPNVFFLPYGCDIFDFSGSGRVDDLDLSGFLSTYFGPGLPASGRTNR